MSFWIFIFLSAGSHRSENRSKPHSVGVWLPLLLKRMGFEERPCEWDGPGMMKMLR